MYFKFFFLFVVCRSLQIKKGHLVITTTSLNLQQRVMKSRSFTLFPKSTERLDMLCFTLVFIEIQLNMICNNF